LNKKGYIKPFGRIGRRIRWKLIKSLSKKDRIFKRIIKITNLVKKDENTIALDNKTYSTQIFAFFSLCFGDNMRRLQIEVSQYTRHKNLETLQVYNDAIQRKKICPDFTKPFQP